MSTMNYSDTYIADSHDYADNDHAACGCGYYEQRAYAPKITTIAEAEGFTLRTIESVGTKYEILWDGEVLNRYPSLKTAETFFMDFAGITKAKYKKIKKVA